MRSNHLSYRPLSGRYAGIAQPAKAVRRAQKSRAAAMRERETRTASSRIFADHPVRTGAGDIPREFDRTVDRKSRSLRRMAGGDRRPEEFILRKEVIQPQVPLRLPCYDFTPVADPTVVSCLLAVGALPSGRTNSHGVTGGVYKARERIHRSMLICDY